MVDIVITSVEDLLDKLNVFPDIDFFRGHSSIEYKLIPSIGRLFSKKEDIIPHFEYEIFEDFKRKYPLFTDIRLQCDFDILFLAQHHGLPTRLLDWTYNPLVALYFASCSNFDKDGCIYHAFPSKAISQYEKGWDPFNVNENLIVIPKLMNIRYRNQNGLFTIYSQPHVEDLSKIVYRYIIPAHCKKTIQTKLKKIGFTRSFIYPSLDSLCSEIVDIHKDRYSPYE
ncbi:FRG domain-containing protein [Parabacteroides sp. BX2]|jgi:hypothetical protein|uniref:FRG domain-containing protein n=1 Tax=Parabacteroides segnis TaxID=2763058 RepID=A0ABR7E4D7_9BACT|nr:MULTISPECIES: FRG domain-containing protein [Parabacteroides]MBC5644053.1 FRG domain-containing protein [Parabacteroides segnis]MCM0714244.1 FRG domain-containing protein [Parabacteroides sp. TA-V-105]